MDPKELKSASRLARAIASDIAVYNGEKIKKGLEDDNVFELLEDDIKEGRDLFRNKVPADIVQNTNLFEKALIDVIIAPRKSVNTKIF